MNIEELTNASGISGSEGYVKKIIREEIEKYTDQIYTDRMGNLIAVKNQDADSAHIALSAHMDEVGLYMKSIDSDGFLKFAPFGIDPRVLVSKTIYIGRNAVPGIIGVKPIHLQNPADRVNAFSLDSMFIDIGATSKEDAEKYVSIGDYAVFESSYREFGSSKIKAKALDDRVGCMAIIEILKKDLPCKITAVFCTQEEIGTRGSAAVASALNADLVINIEGTVCADTSGVDEKDHVTTQGMGPAISLMDTGSIYLRKVVKAAVKVASENGIPYQYRRSGAGGTDGKNYHQSTTGTPVLGISVPCRYIHSPVSVMDKGDYANLLRLAEACVKYFSKNGIN